MANYDASLAELNETLKADSDILDEKYEARDDLENEMASLGRDRDSAKQRIDTFRAMEEHFEGYNNSVRFVMKEYAEGKITSKNGAPCGKIYGPLSKVIRVEDKYVTAVETALAANATTVVLAHNHPSGVAVPSREDIETTRRIYAALDAVDVHLADHVVVAEGDYVSMVQSGYRFDDCK